MKTFGKIMTFVAVLAAIAGAVYVTATYGEQIVAWAKKLLNKARCYCCPDCCDCEDVVAEVAEAEEVPAQENEQEVADTDFEG